MSLRRRPRFDGVSRRLLLIAICVVLSAGCLQGLELHTSVESTSFYLVSPSDAVSEGRLQEYGSYVLASLTSSQVSAAKAMGAVVEEIRFTTGREAYVMDFLASSPELPSNMMAPATAPLQIVQFAGPVKDTWFRALKEESIEIHDYLPHFSYLVEVEPENVTRLNHLPGVRVVVPYHPVFKFASHEIFGDEFRATASLRAVDSDLAATIVAAGGKILGLERDRHQVLLLAQGDWTVREALARHALTTWIEPSISDGATDNNDAAGAIVQSGVATLRPYHSVLVNGSTQIVGFCDRPLNTKAYSAGNQTLRIVHEMFDDVNGVGLVQFNRDTASVPLDFSHRKIVLYYGVQGSTISGTHDGTNLHGNHVAGTIAGDAPLNGAYGSREGYDGVAYAARLVACSRYGVNALGVEQPANPLNDDAYFDRAYAAGARVHSSSWGIGQGRGYWLPSQHRDQYSVDQPDLLILNSMGNAGNATDSVNYAATAKNILAVGATYNVHYGWPDTDPSLNYESSGGDIDQIWLGSARGETLDGRDKPDLVAPGNCVWSASILATDLDNATHAVCAGGTSMSTPLVAGAAALVRDYFAKGFYPGGESNTSNAINVSAALVRGILLGSSREISGDNNTGGYPNIYQGWGRPNLSTMLPLVGDGFELFVSDDMNHEFASGGASLWFNFTVAAGRPFEVILAWTDYPGATCNLTCTARIVNDLDLIVTHDGDTYRGNHFVAGETVPNAGSADRLYVTEIIRIPDPEAGTYTVRVHPHNIPEPDARGYALIVSGEM